MGTPATSRDLRFASLNARRRAANPPWLLLIPRWDLDELGKLPVRQWRLHELEIDGISCQRFDAGDAIGKERGLRQELVTNAHCQAHRDLAVLGIELDAFGIAVKPFIGFA